jgi:hypothetical protein
MTCQECELLLADGGLGGQSEASAEDHLHGCAACRAIQEELHANALALSSLRDDELPRVTMPARRPAVVRPVPWIAAAAAAVLMVLIAHQASQRKPVVETHPQPRQMTAPAAVDLLPPEPVAKLAVRRRKPRPAARVAPSEQPLLVKMTTPDPDVVVYWIVD